MLAPVTTQTPRMGCAICPSATMGRSTRAIAFIVEPAVDGWRRQRSCEGRPIGYGGGMERAGRHIFVPGRRAGATLVALAALAVFGGASTAQQLPPDGAMPGDAILTMMEGFWSPDCDRGDVVRQIIRFDQHILVHRDQRTTLEIVTAIHGNVVDTCAVQGGPANECFRYTVLPDRIVADYLTRGVSLWERCGAPRA